MDYHKSVLERHKNKVEEKVNTLQSFINKIKEIGYENFIQELINKLGKDLEEISPILAAKDKYHIFEYIQKHKDKLNYEFLFPKGYNIA
ncbi:MAG: hypothetical protein GF317_15750 [Candidatus Lokiarchaeota archaeon]|nr:hypothetical protein [Candidatus Lokiarchaeota archaeon]